MHRKVLMFFSCFSIIGCSLKTQTKEEKVKSDSIYEISSFLKNTIYIYNDVMLRANLIDYNYTPPPSV